MRQTRLSIGCADWRRIIEGLGAEVAGVYLYLRTLMRGMSASEITLTIPELARALKITPEAAEIAIARILDAGLLERSEDRGELFTLRCKEEARAIAERQRKVTQKPVRHIATKCHDFLTVGNSGNGPEIPENELKTQEKDFFVMTTGNSEETERKPHTQKKEKSLTEISARPRKASPARQQSAAPQADVCLPADALEAEFIDVCGLMPQSLRDAIKAEHDDVREAFYLYCRQRRTDEGSHWAGDRIRIAWLAARRIPEERRAESILAAAMGNWKTIRDCGSGCYFEKSSGRVVSLVRGPVEYKAQNGTERSNAELAVRLARSMRRA